MDTHVTPPLKPSADHDSAKDRFGESFTFYNDVPSILLSLRAKGVKIAAASRTSAPDLGREMLRLLHLSDAEGKKKKAIEYFDHLEIYPGNKITHFTKLQKATGFSHSDILFFDDESRNRNVESCMYHPATPWKAFGIGLGSISHLRFQSIFKSRTNDLNSGSNDVSRKRRDDRCRA